MCHFSAMLFLQHFYCERKKDMNPQEWNANWWGCSAKVTIDAQKNLHWVCINGVNFCGCFFKVISKSNKLLIGCVCLIIGTLDMKCWLVTSFPYYKSHLVFSYLFIKLYSYEFFQIGMCITNQMYQKFLQHFKKFSKFWDTRTCTGVMDGDKNWQNYHHFP